MSGPAGRVTALDATSFEVTVSALAGAPGTTLALETRPLGSAADWAPLAIAAPTLDMVLAAQGLHTGDALEWRVVERAGPTLFDGTHGIVVPAASLWSTLTATVAAALEGQGLARDAIYVGRQPAANYPDVCVVVRSLDERQQGGAATQSERWVLTVEVELRVTATDATGEQQKSLVETWQARLQAALHERHGTDLPGIPGLEAVRVEVASLNTAGSREQDELSDEVRARSLVRFAIWRSR